MWLVDFNFLPYLRIGLWKTMSDLSSLLRLSGMDEMMIPYRYSMVVYCDLRDSPPREDDHC